ncbi:MAG: hypothetical protein D6805_01815 [Planctomycetota bacterium]|nr:MAG: hypothetical protein D6805_01815 [Planctomycetota bacterium]
MVEVAPVGWGEGGLILWYLFLRVCSIIVERGGEKLKEFVEMGGISADCVAWGDGGGGGKNILVGGGCGVG